MKWHPIIEAVRLRAAAPDWDDEGALPVNTPALCQADCAIAALAGLPEPHAIPEPEGSVVLTWKASRDWAVSLTFNGTREIGYSALLGTGGGYGVRTTDEVLPPDLIALVQWVFRAAGGE